MDDKAGRRIIDESRSPVACPPTIGGDLVGVGVALYVVSGASWLMPAAHRCQPADSACRSNTRPTRVASSVTTGRKRHHRTRRILTTGSMGCRSDRFRPCHVPQVDAHIQKFCQQLYRVHAPAQVLPNDPLQIAAGQGCVDVMRICSHGSDCAPGRRRCPRNIIRLVNPTDQRRPASDERSSGHAGLTRIVEPGQRVLVQRLTVPKRVAQNSVPGP